MIKKSFELRVLVLATFLLPSLLVLAQFPNQNDFPNQGQSPFDTVSTSPLEQESRNRLILPDTMVVKYYHANDLSEIKELRDTSISQTYKYSPARRKLLPNAVSGILGGETYPMFYEEVYRRGVDIGLHQYDLYHKSAQDLKLPETTSGYSIAKYAVGNNQADGYLQFELGRKFSEGVYFAAELNRIFQNGEDFIHQNTNHNGILVGVGINKNDNPYKVFLTYNSNVDKVQNNGGIVLVDSLPESNNIFREVPVVRTPNTQYLQRALVLQQYLSFSLNPKDSLKKPREFTISHEFTYQWNDFKYSDAFFDNGVDSTFYQFFEGDQRGYRFFLEHNTIQNSVAIQTFRNSSKNRSDFFEVGANHQYHLINFAPDTLRRNNLFLFGKWKFQPSKLLKLKTAAHFGILDNAGDYRIEANLDLNVEKWGVFRGKLINQLYEPSILQEQFNFNIASVYTKDFQKTLSNTIGGTLEIPKLNALVGANYHLINNYVFFNDSLRPQQSEEAINILQLFGKLNLKAWKFHLDNKAGIQVISSENLPLPPYYIESALYFQDYIFKDKLGLKTGAEIRLVGGHQGQSFHPLLGQFYNQTASEIYTYPTFNVFAILKRKTFQAFIMMEGIQEFFGPQSLIDKYGQRYYTEVVGYPYPSQLLRWGITWKMFD